MVGEDCLNLIFLFVYDATDYYLCDGKGGGLGYCADWITRVGDGVGEKVVYFCHDYSADDDGCFATEFIAVPDCENGADEAANLMSVRIG